MDKPIVSIIIPCYNHGKYIDEAVDSVLKQTFQTFEIIIINDGSNDEFTNKKLENYSRPNTQVITTANQGLSLARNTGIKMAQGKYILPLDADDKIHPEYLSKAINIIDSSENIEGLSTRLKTLSFVAATAINGNKIDIQLTKANQFGSDILAFLAKENVPLLRYEIMEPSLENVFLEVLA